MIKFPDGFLWGSATSSYQVEGNNTNADWWPWEQAVGKENSGEACRHYGLYEEDFNLVQELNHNAHRLSIEWSRIEPKEGEFAQAEVLHYIHVIKALKARNIEPMVTLHHFTNPIWFSESGGWERGDAVEKFLRFCNVIIRALAPDVTYWITINEPTIYSSHSFLFGNWPPQKKSFLATQKVLKHLLVAHNQGYDLIQHIYKEMSLAKPMVGISHHMPAVVTCDSKLRNRWAAQWRDYWFNFQVLNKIAAKSDFIGINYYSRHMVDLRGWGIGNFIWDICNNNHDPMPKNSLGWDIYPQGLYQILMKLKKYNLPIIITENGICTADDNQRWQFIQDHLINIHKAMAEGVNVTGYLYWSLMDNFEWAEGFTPRFGLIDIDYTSYQRTVRGSARKFAIVCKTGALDN